MHRFKRALLLVGAFVCLSAAAALVLRAGLPQRAAFTGRILPGERPVAPEIDAFAPDFNAPTLAGDMLRLADLRGGVVILNFWATWCAPCRVEMPVLENVYQTHRESGLRVVAVNLGESREQAGAWRDELDLSYDVALDSQGQIAAQYYLRGQPSTYIIAPDGVITQIFFGAVDESRLRAAIAPHLTFASP